MPLAMEATHELSRSALVVSSVPRKLKIRMYDQIFVRRTELKALQVVGYSVTDTAKAIAIDRPQLYRYMKIAKIRIPDYREAEKVAQKKSPKKPLLCPYQVWALAKIRGLFQLLRDENQVRQALTLNKNQFTLTAFLEEQKHGQTQTSPGTEDDRRRYQLSAA